MRIPYWGSHPVVPGIFQKTCLSRRMKRRLHRMQVESKLGPPAHAWPMANVTDSGFSAKLSLLGTRPPISAPIICRFVAERSRPSAPGSRVAPPRHRYTRSAEKTCSASATRMPSSALLIRTSGLLPGSSSILSTIVCHWSPSLDWSSVLLAITFPSATSS